MEKKYPIGGYAPGEYWHKACKTCGNAFIGDKRAWNCEMCGVKVAAAEPKYYLGIEYQSLFEYLSKEHGLTLLQSEMSDLIEMVYKFHPTARMEVAPAGAVWVKASDRLPGLKTPVKWRQGEMEMKVKAVWYMVLDTNSEYLSKCEWLDESAGDNNPHELMEFAKYIRENYKPSKEVWKDKFGIAVLSDEGIVNMYLTNPFPNGHNITI